MPLIHVDPRFLNNVWPKVAPMLQRAIDLDPDEIDISQVELLIRQGHMQLLVWENDEKEVTGAATVEFIDYPKKRVAVVGLMGGTGIVRDAVFSLAQEWMRKNGATLAKCWAKGSLVKMYEKMGMENTHQVMRMAL